VEEGKAAYISTYKQTKPAYVEFKANDATSAAQFIVDGDKFAEFTNPVTSAAAFSSPNGKKWDISSI